MAKTKLLQAESEKHKQAFDYYYSLGSSRSYDKVAVEFGASRSTVKAWGRSFGWGGRVAERDAQVSREVANRTLTDEISRCERNIKIVEMAVMRLARDIRDGRIKTTLADLDRLIRLESFLRKEPDSRPEIVMADLKDFSDKELLEMVGEDIEGPEQPEGET